MVCILQNSEVMVRGGPLGPAGTAIQKLFLAAQKVGFISCKTLQMYYDNMPMQYKLILKAVKMSDEKL